LTRKSYILRRISTFSMLMRSSANNYQNEESETWLGEWMAQRKNRDSIVIATKFTTLFPSHQTKPRQTVNHAGNSTKSLRVSVEASLKKLQTDYIDLLYVHWWDFTTSVSGSEAPREVFNTDMASRSPNSCSPSTSSFNPEKSYT
jgi:aryl-alcohol dehydrogenase-like predicted oxidoreductase